MHQLRGVQVKVPFLDVGAQNRMIQPELDAAYHRVMDSGNYILGQEVDAFEREWAAYCGYKHCVGVASGLDALKLILMGYGIGEGDEVIVPSNTYIATWLAVTAVGARVVPVEPDEATFCIDPLLAADAVTPKTKAILAVHLYGRQCDMATLESVADIYKLKLIVDAAQAHGLKELGDAAGFSFYPTKNLGSLGDGGAVVTNDTKLADRIATLRNYGSPTKNAFALRGINSRLDELQAAFLRAKLQRLDEWNKRRSKTAKRYGQPSRESSFNVNHQYVVLRKDRDGFREAFRRYGIETAVHYPKPPHLQVAYIDHGFRRGQFPIAESLANECVSLPIGHEMSLAEIAAVESSLEQWADEMLPA